MPNSKSFKKETTFPPQPISKLVHWIKAIVALILDPFIRIQTGTVVFVSKPRLPPNGNLRIFMDMLAAKGSHKVSFYLDGRLTNAMRNQLNSQGITTIEGFSLKSLPTLLSAQTLVFSHSNFDAHVVRRKNGRRVINLWHGVPIKQIEALRVPLTNPLREQLRQFLLQISSQLYDHMVASGPHDQQVIAKAFYLKSSAVNPIGLPRYDYLTHQQTSLPEDLERERHALSQLCGERKLILFAPTFREKNASVLHTLNEEVLLRLQTMCEQYNLVFGIRSHPYEQRLLEDLKLEKYHNTIIDLGMDYYSETALVLRQTDLLIVDYTSTWVDFLICNKPILGFIPDKEEYLETERGFIYDLNEIYPGPILYDWKSCIEHIEQYTHTDFTISNLDKYEAIKALLLPPGDHNKAITPQLINSFFS